MIPTIIPFAFNFEQIIEYMYLENHSNVRNFTNFVSFKSPLKSLQFSVKKTVEKVKCKRKTREEGD